MGRPVKATDVRKKVVMAKLKQESKGGKITNVTEVAPDRFEGHCMDRQLGSRKWNDLGRYFVKFELNNDGTLGMHIGGGLVGDTSKFTAMPKETTTVLEN